LTIYRDFMQGFFYLILSGGRQYKTRTTGTVMFASLGSNVISVLRSNNV